MNPDHLRLFLAVQLPPPVKDQLERAQASLRRGFNGPARWTPLGQMHLTLKFLGGVEAQHLSALIEAVRVVCQGFVPLQLSATQIGFFPPNRPPRVVWAGVQDAAGQLPALHRALQQATQPFTTEPPDETFVGHLTLARIKFLPRPAAAKLRQLAADLASLSFGSWTAQGVSLMRSELSSEGARHSQLAFLPFTQEAGDRASPPTLS